MWKVAYRNFVQSARVFAIFRDTRVRMNSPRFSFVTLL